MCHEEALHGVIIYWKFSGCIHFQLSGGRWQQWKLILTITMHWAGPYIWDAELLFSDDPDTYLIKWREEKKYI